MAIHHRKASKNERRLPSRGGSVKKGAAMGLTSLLVSFGLVAITWLVFGQTLWHDFVSYDDHVYIQDNGIVRNGLSPEGLIWAFTHSHASNWHPLTTLSHMLDCQLYGLNAGGHHLTNVILHTISVLLLFLVLKQMTGALWQSAFVAALFAIHPLHVESVAWIAERKDVLSAVFFMLTLGVYAWYTQMPSPARYLLVALFFAFGLMSKPMLVTLPFVLLLLDYWPLRRFANRSSSVSRLVLEKVPLLALSAASCAATILAQKTALSSFEELPFSFRISNALVTYVAYFGQMLWPTKLAVFYPHPYGRLPLREILSATGLLVIITFIVFALRRKQPYLATGWFWYLVMLVPVIGVIQVGVQARADRYTYLPQIGLYVALTWAAADLMAYWRRRREILGFAAAALIGLLSWCAWRQTGYWKNSEALWTHTMAVTSDNSVAHNNLGLLRMREGRADDAIAHYQEALKIRSERAETSNNPGNALIYNNLGNALLSKGLPEEAIPYYNRALAIRPDYGDGHYNLGCALLKQGEVDEAIAQWQKALVIQPQDGEIYTSLGNAFFKKGMMKEAIFHYQQALEMGPQDSAARNNMAWILATSSDASIRDGAKAVDLAQRAVQLSSGRDPSFLRTLAASYAESRRFPEAILTAERGAETANAQGKSALANAIEGDITLYRVNSPLRKPSD
jgi:tetratricopeptide (TPR) repeat protein